MSELAAGVEVGKEATKRFSTANPDLEPSPAFLNNVIEPDDEGSAASEMSKQLKHTPAPWEIRSDIPYSSGLVIFNGYGELNRTVCRVWHPDKSVQRANANLIAAAPELLEALEHMVAVSSWAATVQSEELYDAIISTKTVIRKAKGIL